MAKQKRSKNQVRREKAKLRKVENTAEDTTQKLDKVPSDEKHSESEENAPPKHIEIESDPLFTQFQDVFNKFQGENNNVEPISTTERGQLLNESDENEIKDESNESDSDEEEEPLSKRQLRRRNKIPLATLKSSITRPQVVEWYDVDAHDPYMLVNIKSQPNVVQVPGHWSSKREYLSSRREWKSNLFNFQSLYETRESKT